MGAEGSAEIIAWLHVAALSKFESACLQELAICQRSLQIPALEFFEIAFGYCTLRGIEVEAVIDEPLATIATE
jgi:hypothetical protein